MITSSVSHACVSESSVAAAFALSGAARSSRRSLGASSLTFAGSIQCIKSMNPILNRSNRAHVRPLTRSKEDFRKFLSLQLEKGTLSLDQKKKILTRFWRIWRIWRKIFARSAQTRCEPTKIFSTETLRVYLRVKIFFRFVIQIQILPGKKNFFSREEIEFLTRRNFLARRNFLLARRNFFEKFFYTGKLNPETGIHFLSENLLLI